LCNQRALFEQLKQQWKDASSASPSPTQLHEEESAAFIDNGRELELEEKLKQSSKEGVELGIRIESLQDELRTKCAESRELLSNTSALQAELQDVKFLLEQERMSSKRQASDIAELHEKLTAADSEASSARRRLLSAEENFVKAEEDVKAAQARCKRLEEEVVGLERRSFELQAQAGDALAQKEALSAQLDAQLAEVERTRSGQELAERSQMQAQSGLRFLESENERLRLEAQEAVNEKAKIKQMVDDLVRADQANNVEGLKRDLEKLKARAAHFEREYNSSKQLNSEMTKVMAQMTQAVAERSDEKSDVSNQNRLLSKQVEARTQEVRSVKLERDDLQKQLDSLQSTGNYYQERYREAQEELRNLRHDHSVATATSSKLRYRVESLQTESEDLKAQVAKLNYEVRDKVDDTAKIDRYDQHVRELQRKMRSQDEELDRSQAFAAKSQAVNDCLNTLLVLESEQTSLYESAFPVQDPALLTQFDQKKSKAQSVIARLNEIMTEEERPSIAYMDKRYGMS